MASILIILLTLIFGGYLAFSRQVRDSSDWSATVTPLASIMGSGFLISAPLLGGIVGVWALPCMLALLLLAFGVGSVIRFNIRHFEPIAHERKGTAQKVAFFSRILLSAAYFISICYYLQLLSAFVLHFVAPDNPLLANLLTTFLLVIITGLGMWRGLSQLEKVERYIVSFNLGMIGALLVSLIVLNFTLLAKGTWSLPYIDSSVDLTDFRILLGLLIVVQGFETSRYLGANHPPEQRIRTMRNAQLISTVIYVIFIAGTTVLFHRGLGAEVTEIISMTAPIALVLPILLATAAIGSQFSAAVADTSGAGGLVVDLSENRIKTTSAYALILVVSIALTWMTNVNEIIAWASRAFASYYTLQCFVAALVARKAKPSLTLFFLLLALICLAVALFGLPSE